MHYIKISCSKCGQHIEVPTHAGGQQFECPTCDEEIIVPIEMDASTEVLPMASPKTRDKTANFETTSTVVINRQEAHKGNAFLQSIKSSHPKVPSQNLLANLFVGAIVGFAIAPIAAAITIEAKLNTIVMDIVFGGIAGVLLIGRRTAAMVTCVLIFIPFHKVFIRYFLTKYGI